MSGAAGRSRPAFRARIARLTASTVQMARDLIRRIVLEGRDRRPARGGVENICVHAGYARPRARWRRPAGHARPRAGWRRPAGHARHLGPPRPKAPSVDDGLALLAQELLHVVEAATRLARRA